MQRISGYAPATNLGRFNLQHTRRVPVFLGVGYALSANATKGFNVNRTRIPAVYNTLLKTYK